jgi:hypothetical protein
MYIVITDQTMTEKISIFLAPKRSVSKPDTYCAGP